LRERVGVRGAYSRSCSRFAPSPQPSERLRYEEEILDGIEQAPGAIAHLYRGENMGKLLIRV
jgi:NADPH-dependent curcumin reductase CurA